MRALRVPVVVALLFAVLWSGGSGALAQRSKPKYPPPSPSVLPTIITSPHPPPSVVPSPGPSVEPSRGPEPREPLPFTGADLTLFVVVAAGLTLGGTALVRVARRSRSDS